MDSTARLTGRAEPFIIAQSAEDSGMRVISSRRPTFRYGDLSRLGNQIGAIFSPTMVSRPMQLLYTALAALVLFVAIDGCTVNTSLFLHVFVIGPILFVSTVFFAIRAAISIENRRRCLRQLSTLAIFWATLTAFFLFDYRNPSAIRGAARWLIWSRDYKAQVLAKPAPPNGELRHIDWDSWGGFAQDTTVLLVFDPTDSLSVPARSGQSGKFNGIPCEVAIVHRMESHWYTIEFVGYVDESSWDSCN